MIEESECNINSTKPKLTTEALITQCVIFDKAELLYLEQCLGEGKCKYWTDKLDEAFVFSCVDDAAKASKGIVRSEQLQILKLIKGDNPRGDDVTIYILGTAIGLIAEPTGSSIARKMILDAGISIKCENDFRIITELGAEYLDMVIGFTEL